MQTKKEDKGQQIKYIPCRADDQNGEQDRRHVRHRVPYVRPLRKRQGKRNRGDHVPNEQQNGSKIAHGKK